MNTREDGSVSMGRFLRAKLLLQERGEISTSMIQRTLQVGYSKAADNMDLLEQEKLIGPGDGNKARKALNKQPVDTGEKENTNGQNSTD